PHCAVPGSRYTARLRLDSHDSVAAAVHQQPRRYRRTAQINRGSEEVDLHRLSFVSTGGLRRVADRAAVERPAVSSAATRVQAQRRLSLLTRQDKLVLALMLGIPTAVHLFLVWFPAISSVALSFTRWNGVGGLSTIEPIGAKNYTDIVSIY